MMMMIRYFISKTATLNLTQLRMQSSEWTNNDQQLINQLNDNPMQLIAWILYIILQETPITIHYFVDTICDTTISLSFFLTSIFLLALLLVDVM